MESGNRDPPRFVLKNRDIPIKSGLVAGIRFGVYHFIKRFRIVELHTDRNVPHMAVFETL